MRSMKTFLGGGDKREAVWVVELGQVIFKCLFTRVHLRANTNF